MGYDEKIFKAKANIKARRLWLVFAILLTANYGTDTANGAYSVSNYIIFVILCWLPFVCGDILLKRKGKDNEQLQSHTASSQEMTTDISSQVENVAAMINDMVSLTTESGKHAKVSSEDLEGLAQTAKTMSELSTEVENILTTFRDEFEMVKNETGTMTSSIEETLRLIQSLLRFLFYDHVCYMDCRLLFEASIFSLSNFFHLHFHLLYMQTHRLQYGMHNRLFVCCL